MEHVTFIRSAAFAGALSLLVACSQTGNSVAPAINVTAPASFNRAHQKTLFVVGTFGRSNRETVYAFDYETGKNLGQLAPPPEGWNGPEGACVDSGGNVYFTNTNASTIDEFAHGGTYVATISDPGQYPVACSYDATNGDLAVSNIISSSGGPGSVSLFKAGMLQNTYYPPNMFRVYFLGYQGSTGTLWVDGSNSSGTFEYDSFRAGVFTPVPIVGASIGFPGGVAWSTKTRTMNVGDQDTFSAPTVYQVTPDGKVTGSTVFDCQLPSNICDVTEFAIKGPGIVAGGAAKRGAAALYAYPTGGSPIRIYGPKLSTGGAVAISPEVP